jgi:hypothetical protein
MGDSTYWQTKEGPPKTLDQYFRRAQTPRYRQQAAEARDQALARGVPELELREKCAELLRERDEDERKIGARDTRKRLAAQLVRVARTIRKLPRDEQEEPIIDAFMDFGRQMVVYLEKQQEQDRRRRGRRQVPYYRKTIRDFRALGLRRDEAQAFARGLGFREGRPPVE